MADGTQDQLPLDPADRDFLREVRWRRRVGDDGDSRRRRWILGLLVLVHLVFFLWLRDAMVERGRFAVPGREQVLEVRFYEEETAPVVEVLPGPMAPLPCLSRRAYQRCPDCRNEATCRIRDVFGDMFSSYLLLIESLTLADLLSPESVSLAAGNSA